jgi:trigger factor
MKVTQERLPASRIGLEIEVTPEMSQQVYDKTLRKFARDANIRGFRKGKVPIKILTGQFGKSIKLSALEDLVDESIKKAIEQEKIDALGNIELRSSFEELIVQFKPGSALTISATLDVSPQATLKQYTGLSITAEEILYQPEKVDEVLADYRDRRATRVPVEGRPAQEKDLAVVDFEGTLVPTSDDEEPQEIPGGSATDFELELSEDKFIPGFIEGIIGMETGESKTINATFPDPYPQPDLAGKAAVFVVTLKEIKEKELPELDDDFAQEVSEFETFAELKEALETRHREEAEEKTRANKQQAFLAELEKHLEVELPKTLVRREVDHMITQTAMRLSEQGLDIKKMFTAGIVENLRDRTHPEAVTRLQRTLILGEIVKQASITLDDEAIDAKVKEVLEDIEDVKTVDQARLREVIEEELLKEKIFEWLEANNTVELVPEGTLTPIPDPGVDDELESADEVAAIASDGAIEVVAEEVVEEEVVEASVVVAEVEAEAVEAEAVEAEAVETEATTKKPSRTKSAKPKTDPEA